MAAVGDFADFGYAGIVLLDCERGIGDRPRDGIVFLAGDNQKRSAFGVPRVNLILRPGVEVGGRGLEEWRAGGRNREGLVQLVGFAFVDDVGEGEAELLESQWDGPSVVERVREHR